MFVLLSLFDTRCNLHFHFRVCLDEWLLSVDDDHVVVVIVVWVLDDKLLDNDRVG